MARRTEKWKHSPFMDIFLFIKCHHYLQLCLFRYLTLKILMDYHKTLNVKIDLIAVVAQSPSCIRHCVCINCSTSGFPVLHYLPEFAQTHVRWVSVTIQPSHPLSPHSPLALNLSQHQGFLQWVLGALYKFLNKLSKSIPRNIY